MPSASSVGSGGRTGQTTFNPGPVNTAPIRRQTFRFRAISANQEIVITRACILSLLATFTGASPVVSLLTSARVRALRMWASTTGDYDIQWLSDLGRTTHVTRTYIGGPPTCIVASPPASSRAGMWSRADSLAATLAEPLFALTVASVESGATTSYILDVDLDYVSSDGLSSSLAFTGGTETVGGNGIYGLPLDSLSVSNTVGTFALSPIGIQELFTAKPTTLVRTG